MVGKRKYNSTWREREEYIERRDKELSSNMSNDEKRLIIKKELVEKFGLKDSAAGWQSWVFYHPKLQCHPKSKR